MGMRWALGENGRWRLVKVIVDDFPENIDEVCILTAQLYYLQNRKELTYNASRTNIGEQQEGSAIRVRGSH
jgi:hypothetical protein